MKEKEITFAGVWSEHLGEKPLEKSLRKFWSPAATM